LEHSAHYPPFLDSLTSARRDSDSQDPALFELPRSTLYCNESRTASLGLLGGVGLPLIVHSEVIRMIFMFRNYSTFSANDEALLQSFADQAAIAVRNASYTQIRHAKSSGWIRCWIQWPMNINLDLDLIIEKK
jgi:GAF domain-containing protein